MKVLHADQLARLALKGIHNEPVQKRLIVDKTAKRLRIVLASVLWESRLTQWLHDMLCDNLPLEYLVSYVDAVQTLRVKIPTLIDKMTAGRVFTGSYAKISREGFRILMKRKWDPVAKTLEDQKYVSSLQKFWNYISPWS